MTGVLIDTLETLGMSVELVRKDFSRSVQEVGRASPLKAVKALGLFARLARALRARHADVVILFATNRPASFVVDYVLVRITRWLRAPVVLYMHTDGFRSLARRGRVWSRLVRGMLRRADTIVCLSATLEDDVRPWVSGHVVRSIPNATAAPPVSLASPSPRERPTVLYLSNLIPEKGADEFVRIAVELLNSGVDADFPIVGATADQEFSDTLRSEIDRSGYSKRIKLLGPLYGHKKWETLATADLLLFPSTYRYEAQPMVIIEAFSVGVPVAAYSIGGIGDLVTDDRDGVVAPRGTRDQLRDGVRRVIEDHQVRERMSRAAWATYREHHSLHAYSDAWSDALAPFHKKGAP